MAATRTFGHLPDVPVGAWFPNRQQLHESGVHRPLQAGISGSQHEGADSIVVSGGYEDDADLGDRLIYTGAGGNNPATGEQVEDQYLTRQNLALVISEQERLPVRVVRGSGGDPTYSPPDGYRYDGLYRVVRHWSETGRSGFRIWRFEMVELEDQSVSEVSSSALLGGSPASGQRTSEPEPPVFTCVTCHRQRPRSEMSLSRLGECTTCRLGV